MLGRAMDIKVEVVIIMEVIEKIITTKGVALKVVMQHIDISMMIGAKREENIMETKIVIVGYRGRAGKENIDANEISDIDNVFYSHLNIINWQCDVFLSTLLQQLIYYATFYTTLIQGGNWVAHRGAYFDFEKILHLTKRIDILVE